MDLDRRGSGLWAITVSLSDVVGGEAKIDRGGKAAAPTRLPAASMASSGEVDKVEVTIQFCVLTLESSNLLA